MDGTPFGRYRLVELLGRGGMGEVWRAHDTETDRTVAIKLLSAQLSADDEFQQRFRREAHAAARLNDPHVIPIHHYGEIDGQLYVDMRLIDGRDLEAVLAAGPLDPERAVRIIEQVARALHAAHKVGLIHRDVKPSNILLDADDFAYLIDFGIARVMDEARMTKSGNTLGTFQYIAPERLDARLADDARADIYSLACVLYEALTGQPPFPGHTMAHLVNAHLYIPPPRPSSTRPNVPAQVDDVIATGMAKDPNQRYATTIELADAARDAITDPVARATPAPVTAYQQLPPPPAVTRYRPDTPLPYPRSEFGSGPQIVAPLPTPAPPRRTGLIAAIVAAVVVLASGTIGVAGYLLLHRHGSHGPAAQPAAPSGPPAPNTLNRLLLSVEQINTAMGTTGMSSVDTTTQLPDNSAWISEQACLPLSSAAQAKVYAGTGFSAASAQVVARGQENMVEQAVVLFSSAQQASAFYSASARVWQTCSNRQFTLAANGNSQVNNVGPVSNTNGTLSATITPANSMGVCQRALTVADNVAVDVTACLGPPGAAVSIADQIAAKLR